MPKLNGKGMYCYLTVTVQRRPLLKKNAYCYQFFYMFYLFCGGFEIKLAEFGSKPWYIVLHFTVFVKFVNIVDNCQRIYFIT